MQNSPPVTWVDWVTVAGFILTFVGLALTYRQASQSRTASVAARDAARQAEARVKGNLALVLLARLNDVDRELDLCVRDDDRNGAYRVTLWWRDTAGEVLGLLPDLLSGQEEFRQKLQESVALATAAKESLLDESRTVKEGTRRFKTGVGHVCTEVGVILAQIKTDSGG
jgi:hypothetical protein